MSAEARWKKLPDFCFFFLIFLFPIVCPFQFCIFYFIYLFFWGYKFFHHRVGGTLSIPPHLLAMPLVSRHWEIILQIGMVLVCKFKAKLFFLSTGKFCILSGKWFILRYSHFPGLIDLKFKSEFKLVFLLLSCECVFNQRQSIHL